jgi:HEAT repeat protein
MTDRLRRVGGVAAAVLAVTVAAGVRAHQDPAPAVTQATLTQLGSLDFKTRTTAAQTIRRAPAAAIVPMLVTAATANPDGYVRYQALVLLSGFGPEAAAKTMRDVMGDKNDRLRAVAYGWFEHHPDPSVTAALATALASEQSEFVRPALTRALAATRDDTRVTAVLVPLIQRGVNYFRSAVMEALGDYPSKAAVPLLLEAAQQDGPLRENAIEALGKIGDRSALQVLGPMEASVPADVQPSVAAALCNLGVDCESQTRFIIQMLRVASADDTRAAVTEAAAHALAVLAVAGKTDALAALLDAGEAAREPARSPIALAVGYLAIRQPAVIVRTVRERGNRPATLALLRDAFDILSDEDFERECFQADVRRVYWGAAEGSAERQTAQAIIAALEF